jgi:zinc-binding in reverse transcriptase
MKDIRARTSPWQDEWFLPILRSMQSQFTTCRRFYCPNGSSDKSRKSQDNPYGEEPNISGSHCLISWPQVTLPKQSGGLGIMDIELQNKVLPKWIRLQDYDHDWAKTLASIDLIIDNDSAARTDNSSFFVQDLTTLLPIHRAATQKQQDGTIIPLWNTTFLVHSIYKICNNPGVTLNHFAEIWNLKVPNKIKCFLWLLLHNRLNTADNLQKKGWPAIPHCILCSAQEKETEPHLFQECHFTRYLLHKITGGTHTTQPALLSAWQQAHSSNRQRPWASTMWEIWKE